MRQHQSILEYKNGRYFKLAIGLCAIAIGAYVWQEPSTIYLKPYGGTWLAAALALLRPLARNADDPYYAAVLARIPLDRGDATSSGERAEAQRWRELAAKRYEELLAKHPEAFADHAAEFYLGAGNDPKRALELARRNLDLRVTARSVRLALLAALATNDSESACRYADKAINLGYRPRSPRVLADHAYASCGRTPRT